MRVQDFLSLNWSRPGEALIEPPSRSPVVADPTFLLPSETPDGLYHLFAHTIWGLHRFESADGVEWKHCGLVVRSAMRPFLRRFGDTYYLYYERYPFMLMPLSWLPVPWRSHIEVRTSKDLKKWSSPATCIRPELSWHKAYRMSASVSNPCVVQHGSGFRMYYSASLVFVPDCGFSEPAYIGIAESDNPQGPWECQKEPILRPNPELPGRNLGCGSMKVVPMEDGWIGLQNGIFLEDGKSSASPASVATGAEDKGEDPDGPRSRSAIFLLKSTDGLHWDYGQKEPLIRPDSGWMKSHVYACDCRFVEESGEWALYFNARDEWNVFKGMERIGRITAG